MTIISRKIHRGAVSFILFRHCPSKIFWKCTIWNINVQYKNGWYTLQKLTKPVFAFRHWENLVSSSIYPSWHKCQDFNFHRSHVQVYTWLTSLDLSSRQLISSYVSLEQTICWKTKLLQCSPKNSSRTNFLPQKYFLQAWNTISWSSLENRFFKLHLCSTAVKMSWRRLDGKSSML